MTFYAYAITSSETLTLGFLFEFMNFRMLAKSPEFSRWVFKHALFIYVA